MIRVALLCLFLCPQVLVAETFPEFYSVTGVAADDVLNVRAEPDAQAQIVGEFAPDRRMIEVVALEGDWAVVNTAETTGYVAARFLSREAGPDWAALGRPLTCMGTEPFWNLAILPETRTALMAEPDSPGPQSMAMGQLWPAVPGSRVAAFSVADGFVTLAPADCSDGMSDRRYGIAVDLFLTQPSRPRLSGCCTLTVP